MKYLKLFEDFKNNNKEGSLITQDDIVKCITNKGRIWTETIKKLHEFPDIKHEKDNPLVPETIDGDLVTVTLSGHQFEINLKDITEIEY